MPEIIEVRKCADFIKKHLNNKKIININIINGRYKKNGSFENYKKLKENIPLHLIDVKTKGKLLYLQFDNNLYLINRLGLVGGWCFLKKNSDIYEHTDTYKYYLKYGDKKMMESYIKNSLNHLNFEIITNEGTLYYYDMLSYGTLKCIDNDNELNKILNLIGPDIMNKKTTFDVFRYQILKNGNLDKAIGNVIINQKIISGLGNYLRADILWLSKIDPFKKVKKLTDRELEDIYNNSKILIWGKYNKNIAIRLKIINKNTKLPSDYKRLFYIYMQKEDIYGNKVVKKELYDGSQKRFITYVPNIQK
jgi:formamidopyrimidine-DNA glycosylase